MDNNVDWIEIHQLLGEKDIAIYLITRENKRLIAENEGLRNELQKRGGQTDVQSEQTRTQNVRSIRTEQRHPSPEVPFRGLLRTEENPEQLRGTSGDTPGA